MVRIKFFPTRGVGNGIIGTNYENGALDFLVLQTTGRFRKLHFVNSIGQAVREYDFPLVKRRPTVSRFSKQSMRRTLFYLPTSLFDIPLFGRDGLFLYLLVAATVIALGIHLWRRGWSRECWSYFWIGGLGAVILTVIVPKVVEPSGFPIRSYGVCLSIAVVSAFGLLYRQLSKKHYFSADMLFSMAAWTVVCGILGARLFYVIEYPDRMLASSPDGSISIGKTVVNVVNIAEGGLVVYGSIIAGTVTAIGFMLYHKLPVFKTLDILAPALMLGMAIGRIGCFMNGCCFGAVVPPDSPACGVVFQPGSPVHYHQLDHGHVPFMGLKFHDAAGGGAEVSVVIPGGSAEKAGIRAGMRIRAIGYPDREGITAYEVKNAVQAGNQLLTSAMEPGGKGEVLLFANESHSPYRLEPEKHPVILPVYPTQLYSSAGDLLLCGVLLLLGRFNRIDGLVFNVFLFLYPVMRYVIECYRDDEGSFLGTGFTVAQNVSGLVLVVAVIVSAVIFTRENRRRQGNRPGTVGA